MRPVTMSDCDKLLADDPRLGKVIAAWQRLDDERRNLTVQIMESLVATQKEPRQ